MRVSFIRSIIANKKSDYEIAVIWFDKSDAERDFGFDLTVKEWEKIVHTFSHNKRLNQIADKLFADLIKEVNNQREKGQK